MSIGICSGCGEARNLTKEHLISLPIGKVIVRDREVDTRSMRRLLGTDYVQVQIGEKREETPVADKFLEVYIDNLLCRECNQGWAIELEEAVGPMLYEFVHVRGRLAGTKTI